MQNICQEQTKRTIVSKIVKNGKKVSTSQRRGNKPASAEEPKIHIKKQKRHINYVIFEKKDDIIMTLEENILYLDIETVPCESLAEDEKNELTHIWDEKMQKLKESDPDKYPGEENRDDYIQEAGLYAEFGQIACISFGMFYKDKSQEQQRFCVTSTYGTNEKELLTKFAAMLRSKGNTIKYICGHNAKEFDVPFIAKRMIINGIPLPEILKIYDKKPWDMPVKDTMEMWKFGSYRGASKLKLLCAVFGIPTPKDDIDGSEVARVYYKEQNYARIAKYCEKDVVATMRVYLHILGFGTFEDERITPIPAEPCLK